MNRYSYEIDNMSDAEVVSQLLVSLYRGDYISMYEWDRFNEIVS